MEESNLPVKKVWTFLIRSPEAFDLSLPRTPRLLHTGGTTVWKMVGTEKAANATQAFLLECLDQVTVEMFTEGQDKTQAAIRRGRLMGDM